jgi:hypothetical protein
MGLMCLYPLSRIVSQDPPRVRHHNLIFYCSHVNLSSQDGSMSFFSPPRAFQLLHHTNPSTSNTILYCILSFSIIFLPAIVVNKISFFKFIEWLIYLN